jgi:hypothetical protein
VEHVVMDAIERQDWPLLKQVLHPYVHWTENGVKLRGRTNVLAHVVARPHVIAPTAVELRDGQVYRWTASD